jgi:molybdate transport system substrate-binding protein
MVRLSLVVALVALVGCGGKKPAVKASNQLLVLVPCGMEMPFDDLAKAFEQKNPGLDVRVELEVAQGLAKRITDVGQRPDVVVSPGGVELEPLIEQGFVKKDALAHLGIYDLMLFVPRANKANVTNMESLLQDSVKVVAVADPDKTSIGRFTKEALVKKGLWDKLKDKIVITGSASDTYAHVSRGKADASFAYRSCPLKTAPDKLQYSRVRILEEVPKSLYGPAYVTAAPLVDPPNPEKAREFIALLLSKEGQDMFRKYDLPSMDSKDAK